MGTIIRCSIDMYVYFIHGPNHSSDETSLKRVTSWSEVELAVRQLDGINQNVLLLISADESAHMSINGGENNQYALYVTYDEETYHILLNSEKSDEKVSIVVGGQRNTLIGSEIIGLDIILQASETFCETGELDSRLEWKLSDPRYFWSPA